MKMKFWQKIGISDLIKIFCFVFLLLMTKKISAEELTGACTTEVVFVREGDNHICRIMSAANCTTDGGTYAGDGTTCSSSSSEDTIPEQADFGNIEPDLGDYGEIHSGEDGLAEPIKFANNIIAFSTTVIGIWFLINIILQGIKIINNSKDPKAFNESVQKIIWSIAGIALVALAYVIAGWVSAQLFGDTATILNPSI